jgi:large subunit ribosomal protein L21
MYAIVEIGGKQYKVAKDMILDVDKVADSNTQDINIEKVLMYVDGDKVVVGKPYLSNVAITAKVLGEIKGKKVHGIKFKKRKNYTRNVGHREQYLQVKIEQLSIA